MPESPRTRRCVALAGQTLVLAAAALIVLPVLVVLIPAALHSLAVAAEPRRTLADARSWRSEPVRVVELVYFMAPAYLANMVPPFVRYWKGWNPPIAAAWLGSHKTVLGFAAGVGAAVLLTFLQSRLGWSGAIVDYDGWLDLGARMGVGAMLGDSVKSFFKRRRGVAPGGAWIPFDQLDFVLGALLFVWRRAALAWTDVVIVLALSFVGHILVNHLGYWLGVREAKW